MIYIASAASATDLRVPRTTDAPIEGAELRFVSTVGLTEYATPVASISVDGDYYAIRADLSALKATGEYEYHLTAKGVNLASGLAMVGEIPSIATEQYEKQTEYEQYEQD